MIECEKHRYGKWKFLQSQTSCGVKYKEYRSCLECGSSQVRPVERIDNQSLNISQMEKDFRT